MNEIEKNEIQHLPRITIKRVKGQKYMYKNKIVLWSGMRINCLHGKRGKRCKVCGFAKQTYKSCNMVGCDIHPNYNTIGKKALYCYKHKFEGMIDVKNKRCENEGCIKQPSYNYECIKIPMYCSNHKLEDMVNVKSKKCCEEGCTKHPSYNTIGKIPMYCSKHKLEGMVNVKDNKCLYEGCNKRPSCNYVCEKKSLYCSEHKVEGMVNVKNKRCLYEGCNKQPSYNTDGKPPTYCLKHKLKGMVNVVNKRCKSEECLIHPTYNIIGKTPLFFSRHKLKGMIDVSKKCEHDKQRSNCPKCCPINLRFTRFCLICAEHSVKSRRYGTPGVCAKCDKTIPERIEHKVKNHIIPKLPITSSNDSQLSGKICGEAKRRADMLWIGQDRVIQVEIDENEHKSRSVSCEMSKIDSSKWGLHVDDQCKPMFFIRFNPDGCKTEEEFYQRCDQLVISVKKYLQIPIHDDLKTRVIYMYYSDDNKHLLATSYNEHFIVEIN